MRRSLATLVLVALAAACGSDADPLLSVEETATTTTTTAPPTTTTPPAETEREGAYLAFDGRDDRVLVPWDDSFPTEVFTAAARVLLSEPPARRSAIIARGEDDDSWDLSWQLFVGSDGGLQVMIEASNMDNYCYPGNDCVPQGECESGDMFIADGNGTTSPSPAMPRARSCST